LQELSQTALQIQTNLSSSERLKCPPMVVHLREIGDKPVRDLIMLALAKCSTGLDISLSPIQLETLTEDLIDKYKFDAAEDVIEALKKGRQGFFGNTFGKLNMIIISEWMHFVLTEKASTRERELHRIKMAKTEELPAVDYNAYKIKEKKKQEEAKAPSLSEMQYQAKKYEYFNNKKD